MKEAQSTDVLVGERHKWWCWLWHFGRIQPLEWLSMYRWRCKRCRMEFTL